ncbi:hypothetical protein HF086_015832 [Spodoptera exigua]|uniref:NAD(P)H oxidase (H2O2-forming) n=1 Tax=Spodoptera exigua TaxID=7107 RepID=A0A922M385_SPOEX|nr:hypothetical protein HF086_015832 [Spodoptera exigua]
MQKFSFSSVLGDPRTNQNPAMVTFGILLLRWHNVVAARVHRQHPEWSDEQLFQRARRIVIASLQNIILNEYVPAFLGVPLPPYKGYRADVAPGVTHSFAVAAFRFGHTLVPPAILLRDRNCKYGRAPGGHDAIRLCQTWWDGNDVMSQVPIEEVLLGMASQVSEREDALLCSDVRDNLFGPMEFSRRDLGALNIMRGRDNGLPDYNTASIFTKEEIAELRQITMWDIIVNSTSLGPRDLQRDVFHWRAGDPCPQPYQLNASKLPPCKYLRGYDYFEVRSVDKMVCREWVHASHKRLVKLRLGPEPALHVTDRKGDKLRTLPLDHTDQLTVLESQESRTNKRPLVLIRAPREHDLVLEMDSAASRRKFLVKLDTFLANHKKALNLTQGHREQILATAETRERRQRKLEHFFREAYAITFGLAPGEKRHRRNEEADPESIVMRTSLSKSEFASALGMKADAVFVKKMFNIVDKDGDGRISFQDAGLQHKDHLTYSDFKVMMKEYKGEFVAIGLDCKGAKQNFLDTSTNVARMTSFHIEPPMEQSSIQQYIPLDSSIQFHKIVACTALFFSLLHTAGHMVNFYHVSTQPVENLRCLTKEVHFTSDFRPGVSGVLLFVIMCVIFVFAHPVIRKRAYPWFWRAHSLHVLLYALCLVHGLARLTGAPRFWIFFLGPAIIYTLDKVVSLRTKYLALDVLETEMLPSDVIKIKFYRPPNLKYLSGQWVRLSCTAFKKEEFHSFTLTSAPHENFLSCHIKAQGPWTWKLRNYFDPCNFNTEDHPKIRIQGPFGGGNQDWYKFEVAVMVGGGIGVTPYASILNDLVFGTSTNRYSGVACKKVYFLWICPSHKHFEWFIDVLRDVERKDVTNVLEIHIFITQFFHKFDLRTTMLYICENHFQRLSRTSMFTGLKAVNHFGRPDMSSFLKFVQKKHSYVSKIGVFSCGPRPLTKSVMSACEQVNRTRRLPYFIHHFENFG